jgi:putative ABC transport system permease protein
MLYETVRLALQAIFRNALRSFLTVLGVVIGVGAVIAMVTIGNGTTGQVQSEIASLFTTLLFVRPGQGSARVRLTRRNSGLPTPRRFRTRSPGSKPSLRPPA